MRRLSLLLVALASIAAADPVSLDDLSDPFPPFGFILTAGITPKNLVTNIDGFARALLEHGDYDRKLRAKGLTLRREEALKASAKSYASQRSILLEYLAWLQNEVEAAPEPGSLKEDDVNFWMTEKGIAAAGARRPIPADFKVLKKEKPEHERSAAGKLEAGDLQFKGRR